MCVHLALKATCPVHSKPGSVHCMIFPTMRPVLQRSGLQMVQEERVSRNDTNGTQLCPLPQQPGYARNVVLLLERGTGEGAHSGHSTSRHGQFGRESALFFGEFAGRVLCGRRHVQHVPRLARDPSTDGRTLHGRAASEPRREGCTLYGTCCLHACLPFHGPRCVSPALWRCVSESECDVLCSSTREIVMRKEPTYREDSPRPELAAEKGEMPQRNRKTGQRILDG
eukprot:scaffold350_cov333-Pavlova_lutheri.AAC.22